MKKPTKLEIAADTVKTLTKAREWITPRNRWVRGALHSGKASCALGAINRALNNGLPMSTTRDQEPACVALAEAIRPGSAPHAGYTIIDFNDRQARSHAEVLGAFDRAIKDQCAVVQHLAKKQKEKHHGA